MYKIPHEDFSVICDLRSSSQLETSAEQLRQIKNSVSTNNYYVFKNRMEDPIGYAIWAMICKESLIRIARTSMLPQFFYEWNDGRITLILDIFLHGKMDLCGRKQLSWLKQQNRILSYQRKGQLKIRFSGKCVTQKMIS